MLHLVFLFLWALPPRYHYPVPKIFYVQLSVGTHEFIGEGRTRQAARHNAAMKALQALRNEPIPERPPQVTTHRHFQTIRLKASTCLPVVLTSTCWPHKGQFSCYGDYDSACANNRGHGFKTKSWRVSHNAVIGWITYFTCSYQCPTPHPHNANRQLALTATEGAFTRHICM